jgi:hypothetical protein
MQAINPIMEEFVMQRYNFQHFLKIHLQNYILHNHYENQNSIVIAVLDVFPVKNKSDLTPIPPGSFLSLSRIGQQSDLWSSMILPCG